MANVDRWTQIGRWFMVAWVPFAVPTALAVLASGFHPPQEAATFGFTVWGALWAWIWLRAAGRNTVAEFVGLVGITVILTFFTLIQPSPVGGFLVFAFIVAGACFPLRRALWIMAGLSVLQVALSVIRLSDLATASNGLINSILVGGVGIGARLLWQSYRELVAAREEIARLAVSEERLRFSRDLHDLLGQSLAVLVLKSELVAKQVPSDTDESTRQELRDLARVARKSLNDVREAAAGYRRPTLSREIGKYREMKLGASTRVAFDPDASTHQLHQHRSDRQPQPSASVLACRGTIGLGKRPENDALLFGRNADTGIADREMQLDGGVLR